MIELYRSNWRERISPGSAEAYVAATVCVAIAAIARWLVGLVVPDVVPFPTFFAAILIATLIGGKGPGLFAAVLGGVLGWWAFMTPPMAWFPLTAGQQLSIAIYFIASFVIVWAALRYQGVVTRLEQEEKFRQLAVEELAHRLKNKVATIQSIVTMRLRDNPEARDEIVSCLSALQATDELILATQGKGAVIDDILAVELEPYDATRLHIRGPNVLLPPKLAMTMALLFHELATNAAKYGALSSSSGNVSVTWSCSDPWLNLEWRESNGPLVSNPNQSGFGTKLLQRALEQFNGKTHAAFEPTGLICRMEVPLSDLDVNTVPTARDTTKAIAQKC